LGPRSPVVVRVLGETRSLIVAVHHAAAAQSLDHASPETLRAIWDWRRRPTLRDCVPDMQPLSAWSPKWRRPSAKAALWHLIGPAAPPAPGNRPSVYPRAFRRPCLRQQGDHRQAVDQCERRLQSPLSKALALAIDTRLLAPATIDKMAIHPLGEALNFKADDPVEAALQGAFLAAISLKFDHQLSSKPKPRH
jgi:hypothetical protein